MPPRVKFQKEEIARAALKVAGERGAGAVTAREVAKELGVSTRPIFTYYSSMDALRLDVYELAKEYYKERIQRGLTAGVPFLGLWQEYLRFAREEPELYKLLFLTDLGGETGGAAEALAYSQDLARASVMKIYDMDACMADCFFRDVWLVAFSFGTMIVTGNCPYTDGEILAVGREISVSVCKAYKEIPGLPEGRYDPDRIFKELVRRS